MKSLFRRLASLMMIATGTMCAAQSATIPFRQIERGAATQRNVLVASNADVSSSDAPKFGPVADYSVAPASSGSAYVLRPVYKKERVLDTKFFLVNGLHLGMAALDVALTQHCIAAERCREGNPLMPSSLGGQLAVDGALVTSSALISFHLKKQNSKMWWFSPTIGIGAHAVGAVSGLMNY